MNANQVNTIMAEVDVDHNGKMDLSEFILMMHKQVNFFRENRSSKDSQVGSTDTMEEMRIAFRCSLLITSSFSLKPSSHQGF